MLMLILATAAFGGYLTLLYVTRNG